MANVKVYNMEGNEVGTIELNDAVFGAEINEHLVHLAVVRQLANKRQGTQSAKGRSEVSGGGRKPWRQKGTGHARQGSIRAAQWTGGGIIWAPKPRDYSFKMNKKERRAALRSALTSKVQDEKLIVLDSLVLNEIKTKDMVKVLNNIKAEKALVVTADDNTDNYLMKEEKERLIKHIEKLTHMSFETIKSQFGYRENDIFKCLATYKENKRDKTITFYRDNYVCCDSFTLSYAPGRVGKVTG